MACIHFLWSKWQTHGHLLVGLSLKTGKNWLQQSWILVPNYNGGPGRKMRLRLLDNEIQLEAQKFPASTSWRGKLWWYEKQSLYNDHTQDLWHAAALNSWDRTDEEGKKIGSFNKVIQSLKETFTDFIQILTSSISRIIPKSEARQKIIESLTFKNANSQCKGVIRPLEARSAPLEEWILDAVNIESHEHNDPWIREVISRGLKKNWNVKCFSFGKQSHLKRDYVENIPRKSILF